MGRAQPTYDELMQPPKSRWARMKWAIVRWLLRWIGRPLSRGVATGYRHGFDSGPMLDYVYRNKAHGRLLIGRLVDRMYLNAVGWKGIRQRKAHLQELLRGEIAGVRRESGSVHVADVAAGPGRYLLELAAEQVAEDLRVTLRDWDEEGLRQGRAIAGEFGVRQATFARGDAFSADSLAEIRPKPDIVVVSGLYELFADNERILASLRGIHSILPGQGRLVYTNQPTHPQLEFIARCLPNRDGEPWVMRLRTQDEMDELVRQAGFEKEDFRIDEWGIFTVSTARKAG